MSAGNQQKRPSVKQSNNYYRTLDSMNDRQTIDEEIEDLKFEIKELRFANYLTLFAMLVFVVIQSMTGHLV